VILCLTAILGFGSATELLLSPPGLAATATKDDPLCSECKQLIGQVLNNNTLQQFLHQVESYCSYLPGGFGEQCKKFIDQYGQQLINEILSKYNPDTVCKDLLHLCQGKQIFMGIPLAVVPQATKQQDPCGMCKQVIGQFINKNTLEQVLHTVEKLCDQLPGGFGSECKSLIDSFGEQIINQIIQTYTPEYVCKDLIHVCSFNKQNPVVHDEHPLLVKMVVNKLANDQLCDTCMNVAGQILNNATLQALLQRADTLCDRLPGWLGDQCHQMIESEGKRIIAEILKFTPDKLCKTCLHLC